MALGEGLLRSQVSWRQISTPATANGLTSIILIT